MKVLVTAASKYGSTGEIAVAIAEALSERGIDATSIPPEEVGSVEEYDAVVLGSAVYAGRWLKPARDLVERSGEAFANRPVWLFSSGPIGDPPKPEGEPVDVADLMESTKAREHHVFAGELVKKRLSFGDKAIAMALRAQEGDFREWDRDRGVGLGDRGRARSGVLTGRRTRAVSSGEPSRQFGKEETPALRTLRRRRPASTSSRGRTRRCPGSTTWAARTTSGSSPTPPAATRSTAMPACAG